MSVNIEVLKDYGHAITGDTVAISVAAYRAILAVYEAAWQLVDVLEADGEMFDAWFYSEFVDLADALGVKVHHRSENDYD